MINKRAQEEMVGFAMIIIIVAVILLILLGISLNKPKTTTGVESYEVESFILATLQHTSTCSTDFEFSNNDVRNLIVECDAEQVCEDGRTACVVLETTLEDILDAAWKVGGDRPVKGYELNITSKDASVLSLNEGNVTSNYKGGVQNLVKRGSSYAVDFKAYY